MLTSQYASIRLNEIVKEKQQFKNTKLLREIYDNYAKLYCISTIIL